MTDKPAPKNKPFSAPAWLNAQIDAAAERAALSRSAWIRQAALEKLKREQEEQNVPVNG